MKFNLKQHILKHILNIHDTVIIGDIDKDGYFVSWDCCHLIRDPSNTSWHFERRYSCRQAQFLQGAWLVHTIGKLGAYMTSQDAFKSLRQVDMFGFY